MFSLLRFATTQHQETSFVRRLALGRMQNITGCLTHRTSRYQFNIEAAALARFSIWRQRENRDAAPFTFAPDRWEGKVARNQNAFENNRDSRVEKLRHAAGAHKIDSDHRQVVAPVKTNLL